MASVSRGDTIREKKDPRHVHRVISVYADRIVTDSREGCRSQHNLALSVFNSHWEKVDKK